MIRRAPASDPYPEGSWCITECFSIRTVRVVLGRLGSTVRLSAHDLGVVVDGDTIEQAWDHFLRAVGGRDDAAWLMFDVGPTRPEEVDAGIDASEDEDWSEPVVA